MESITVAQQIEDEAINLTGLRGESSSSANLLSAQSEKVLTIWV
jgi:hypothetical protein